MPRRDYTISRSIPRFDSWPPLNLCGGRLVVGREKTVSALFVVANSWADHRPQTGMSPSSSWPRTAASQVVNAGSTPAGDAVTNALRDYTTKGYKPGALWGQIPP